MGAVVIRNPCYTPQGDNPNNNIDGGIYSDYPMLVEIVRLAKKKSKNQKLSLCSTFLCRQNHTESHLPSMFKMAKTVNLVILFNIYTCPNPLKYEHKSWDFG
jgi:hypothetical protein